MLLVAICEMSIPWNMFPKTLIAESGNINTKAAHATYHMAATLAKDKETTFGFNLLAIFALLLYVKRMLVAIRQHNTIKPIFADVYVFLVHITQSFSPVYVLHLYRHLVASLDHNRKA